MGDTAPHSADVLTDHRYDWWNRDYLALLAQRFSLGEARSVLDVGCGHGHWGLMWAPWLSTEASLLGVDREPQWAKRAQQLAAEAGLADRFRYLPGDVHALPVPDGGFDLVTCQTVLMHVPDAATALAEMARALAPGGRMLVSEPNNLAEALVTDSVAREGSVEDAAAIYRFLLTCQRGRAASGQGDSGVGARLPELLKQAGLCSVEVFLNDRVIPALPPYDEVAGRMMTQMFELMEKGAYLWGVQTARQLYLAGGGTQAQFNRDHALYMERTQQAAERFRAGTLEVAGAHQHYIATAVKP